MDKLGVLTFNCADMSNNRKISYFDINNIKSGQFIFDKAVGITQINCNSINFSMINSYYIATNQNGYSSVIFQHDSTINLENNSIHISEEICGLYLLYVSEMCNYFLVKSKKNRFAILGFKYLPGIQEYTIKMSKFVNCPQEIILVGKSSSFMKETSLICFYYKDNMTLFDVNDFSTDFKIYERITKLCVLNVGIIDTIPILTFNNKNINYISMSMNCYTFLSPMSFNSFSLLESDNKLYLILERKAVKNLYFYDTRFNKIGSHLVSYEPLDEEIIFNFSSLFGKNSYIFKFDDGTSFITPKGRSSPDKIYTTSSYILNFSGDKKTIQYISNKKIILLKSINSEAFITSKFIYINDIGKIPLDDADVNFKNAIKFQKNEFSYPTYIYEFNSYKLIPYKKFVIMVSNDFNICDLALDNVSKKIFNSVISIYSRDSNWMSKKDVGLFKKLPFLSLNNMLFNHKNIVFGIKSDTNTFIKLLKIDVNVHYCTISIWINYINIRFVINYREVKSINFNYIVNAIKLHLDLSNSVHKKIYELICGKDLISADQYYECE